MLKPGSAGDETSNISFLTLEKTDNFSPKYPVAHSGKITAILCFSDGGHKKATFDHLGLS